MWPYRTRRRPLIVSGNLQRAYYPKIWHSVQIGTLRQTPHTARRLRFADKTGFCLTHSGRREAARPRSVGFRSGTFVPFSQPRLTACAVRSRCHTLWLAFGSPPPLGRCPCPTTRPSTTSVTADAAGASSRAQGDAGLGIAIAYFSRIGVRVGIPLTDSQPYDLLIDNDGELSRGQVRTTTTTRGRYYFVSLKTVGAKSKRVLTKLLDAFAYEWLFVVCGDATAFLIPAVAIAARHSIQLGGNYEAVRIED